ncbi:MAG: hypothetical protein N2260_07895 [Syntrophobacterales bacterium]|nr:hypothetical protein [Syntrophobacterales bacterium]
MKQSKILRVIEIAQEIYSNHGEVLKHHLKPLVERACGAIERSKATSTYLGIGEICRRCDEEEGGSCCGVGIEAYYTPELIVANMLLGIHPSHSSFNRNSCYFLGKNGCLLVFRHTLCVNFLCKRLYDLLGTERIILLQTAIGEEIEITFKLCEAISRIVRGQWDL